MEFAKLQTFLHMAVRGNSFYFITFNFEGNVFFLVENFVDELFSNPEFWAKKQK